MSVRPGDSFRQADPSASYAQKLHEVLLNQGVEHYVVTYQYRYYTGHYEEAVGTRTAVVYRDEADSHYPWWLKDDRTATPFWLPNGDLNAQLSFYARRKAEVIEQKHYPAHGGNKEVVTPHRTAQNKVQFRGGLSQASQPKAQVTDRPQPVTKIAQVKPAPAQATKAVVTYRPPVVEKTAVHAPVAHTAVTKIQHTPSTATASASKPQPLPEVAAFAPESPRLNSFWSPPATIDPVQQANEPAPRDGHLEKLFRARNGTTYDPTSATDRRKMEQLKHGLVGKETTGERGFRRGVDSGTPGMF